MLTATTANCPWCHSSQEGPNGTSRTLGIVQSGVYDGALFWCCPDCDGRWQRWPEGDRLHEAAKPYIVGPL